MRFDLDLAISKKLRDNPCQKQVVGLVNLHGRGGLEARGEIWQTNLPGGREPPCGEQQLSARRAHRIDEMKQPIFVEGGSVGVVNQNGLTVRQTRQGTGDGCGGKPGRTRILPPLTEMEVQKRPDEGDTARNKV